MDLTLWTDWRRKSLLRPSVIVLLSLLWAFRLSHFPSNYPTLWLVVPTLLAMAGTADTVRCMQPRWSWYHGGVVLLIYMDLMVLTLILFFLIYPYW